MRVIGISFFFILVIFQTFDRFGAIAYYHLNKEYIINFFCINKDTPQLKCHGKCHLKAKLSEQEQKKNEFPSKILEKIDIQYLTQKHKFKLQVNLPSNNNLSNFCYTEYFPQPYSDSVFRPPKS